AGVAVFVKIALSIFTGAHNPMQRVCIEPDVSLKPGMKPGPQLFENTMPLSVNAGWPSVASERFSAQATALKPAAGTQTLVGIDATADPQASRLVPTFRRWVSGSHAG